jgi:iron-sulfur cluster protein
MSSDREQTAAHIRRLLDEEGDVVEENASLLNQNRQAAESMVDDYDDLRDRARAIKEDAIERLPELLDELRASVEANGGHVYVAEDAADANAYVESVCDDADAETVVKSKSMTTEEIDLNDDLEAAGLDVHETDLGEWVLQVADDTPSHIVGPAMHLSTDRIAELFNERFDPDDPLETPEELTTFARDWLGERIRDADVGVTGANFLVAETGTMTLITNEGNARKTAVTPDTHVAVAGIEKILPTVGDLQPFVELIARAATGQAISQYVSMLTPPTDSPGLDFDAPDEPMGDTDREFHLVLLDNGRREMREDDDLRETLYCVRCGACSNSCANFQHVGGHGFGGETYSGGIATGWEAGVHGLDSAAEFNDLCTGCSRCEDACPVKIDIPWINTVVRDRVTRGDTEPGNLDWLVEGLTPDVERDSVPVQKRLFGNADTLMRLGSATAPVTNWLANRDRLRDLADEYAGIAPEREFPTFARETLTEWFEDRDVTVTDPDETVVLYPDPYTNYVRVDRGRAAVRVLEALGVEVVLGDPIESGRAPLSQGMVATARAQARKVYRSLALHLDEGRPVVVVEPSDAAIFRDEYRRLLPKRSAVRMTGASFEVCEYVHGLLANGATVDSLADGTDTAVTYHGHCQAKTEGFADHATEVLERAGYDVATTSAECCGMAGSFGYKSEYYDLSVDVGESLVDELDPDRPVVAAGTSCCEQLDGLTDDGAVHPIRLLDPGAR